MTTVTQALETFVEVFGDGYLSDSVAKALTCVEVEALADLFDSLGIHDAAEQWRDDHAQGDDEGDAHFDRRRGDDR